ncbi:selenocysteine-specific translation elongation factor [candidate division KSB1 bacterium]|nr:selenocysteine-specific translation elongation factor [candidate division KSB1 bacterium]
MNQEKRQFIIGTAGHIDHGKTSLVIQLTGTDTDRLREEKERGMTIDLGFAYLHDDITIIDVPGHEKFIRNMVAGVSTIDMVLFVIAADDGIMPQTREHLEIINLLQIQRGIIVLTKCDLVDPEWSALVEEDIRDLMKNTILRDAPLIKVSNATGEGIDELKNALFHEIDQIDEKKDKGIFRLNVDRVFTMKGFGTVAAGTVVSGSIRTNDEVELLPQRMKLRIRGIQTHGKSVAMVKMGDRAAINLMGIDKDAIERGHVLAAPDYFIPSRFFDSKFYLLKSSKTSLKNTARVRVHIGTTEVMGRITLLDQDALSPGETAYAQFKLEKVVVADFEDRFVVRSYSPVVTIGGGKIVDPLPRKHKRHSDETIESIRKIEDGDTTYLVKQIMLNKPNQLFSLADISRSLSLSADETKSIITRMMSNHDLIELQTRNQQWYLLSIKYEMLKENILNLLMKYHLQYPALKGITLSELKLLFKPKVDSSLINHMIQDLLTGRKITRSDEKFHLTDHVPRISEKLENQLSQLERLVFDGRFTPLELNELKNRLGVGESEFNELILILYENRKVVKIDTNILIHADVLNEAMQLIRDFFKSNNEITVGDCGKILNTSRKYSLPLLNYLDGIGFTIRQQDKRILNDEYINK